MKMTGLFHLTLLPSADDTKFETQITEVAFTDVSAVRSTRATRGVDHVLLKKRGALRQYVWQIDIDLISDRDYDFAENIARVQDALLDMAVVTGLDIYQRVG